MNRLVSLAPSATGTIEALGAADRLVGTTAHCDVDGVPVVGGWLTPDLDRLDALEPDLVLTADPLQREVREAVHDAGFQTFHHEPSTLEDVIEGFADLGAAIGRAAKGRQVTERAWDRLRRVEDAVPSGQADRPVVYCEEWGDPPMAAGNWVPEAVETAGGRYPFGEPGERSGEVGGPTVAEADPDHVVVHHCGFGERAESTTADEWDLDAAVHVIDDALLNQPGPRLVDGVERLAELFHGYDRPAAAFGTEATTP